MLAAVKSAPVLNLRNFSHALYKIDYLDIWHSLMQLTGKSDCSIPTHVQLDADLLKAEDLREQVNSTRVSLHAMHYAFISNSCDIGTALRCTGVWAACSTEQGI